MNNVENALPRMEKATEAKNKSSLLPLLKNVPILAKFVIGASIITSFASCEKNNCETRNVTIMDANGVELESRTLEGKTKDVDCRTSEYLQESRESYGEDIKFESNSRPCGY